MNRLFVAYKPSGLSSNQFLRTLKRKYGVKKAGYSGTLDPFAKGVLIVAFGKYTSLFRFLDKTPKRYRATLWLGAHSDTLDIEGVERIDDIAPLPEAKVREAVESLQGEQAYPPPIFSAKRINGKRAYDLARAGIPFELETIRSKVYDVKLLHYCHPFVTFEATVSEGTYIRSLGRLVYERLGLEGGSLSMLERLCEGQFVYEGEKPLDIRGALRVPPIEYKGEWRKITLGQPLTRDEFAPGEDGFYRVDDGRELSIFSFDAEGVHYVLNKVAL
ncbi:tRNA pseudouridine(55) synthase TruB [Sulfurimonas sp. HSL1-6]|uniref:tRNA pseudouridine(55) synthase TruB n=1 Tax=Thiomicrolovo immobilis TaxID=3131935 RepID=UPI0031F857D3